MKKLLLVCSLAVALIGVMSFNAAAVLIDGAISFSGTSVTNDQNLNEATAFVGFSDAVVSTGEGDYASVESGQAVTFTPFEFRPFSSSVTPLWTFEFGGLTYSFDATGITTLFSTQHILALEGPGIAYITGFDATPGTWSLSSNTAGSTASFSASAATVPEPATMLLLGAGLIGLAGIGRKKFFKK